MRARKQLLNAWRCSEGSARAAKEPLGQGQAKLIARIDNGRGTLRSKVRHNGATQIQSRRIWGRARFKAR